MSEKENENNFKELREKAEQKADREKKPVPKEYEQEFLKTIHELRVHQIELEMQNDELLRTQSELEESRSRYSDLFDFAPIGYFVTDKTGNITKVNLIGATMVGVERNQLTQMPFALFIDNQYRDIFYINRQKLLKSENKIRLDLKMVRKDKSSFYAEIIMEPITTSDNKIKYCHIAVIDISERKKAQEKLYQSEKKYRSLFNTMSEGFALHEIVCDDKGKPCDYKFLDVNPAFERQTGLKAEDIIGKTVKEVIPDIEKFWIDIYGEVALTGKSNHFDNYSKILDRYYEIFAYCPAPMQFAVMFMDITDRKQAEEKLIKSQNQIQGIIDNTPALVYMLDLNERFLLVNKSLADLLNSSPEKMIGKRRHEFMPKDYADEHEENDRKAIKAGKPIEFEEYSELQGCSITWLTTKFPLRDSNGEIYAVAGITSDITERRQAEEALRASEERLRLATQAAKIGAFEWNVQTGVNVWTPELEEMYGLVHGEFGKTQPAWEQLVHPEDREMAVGLVNQTFETGEPVEGEWRVVWRDGSVHWITGRFQGFNDANGTPLRLTGVNIDITERKNFEEALRASEQENSFLAGVIQHSSQPFAVSYPDGRLGLHNKAFENLTGYNTEELLKLDWTKVLTPPEWIELEKEKLEELQKNSQSVRYEKEYIRKDGSRVPIELLVHLVRDEKGKPLYYYSFLTDITDRIKVQNQILLSAKQRQLALDSAQMGWWHYDPITKLASWDDRYKEIFGITGYSRSNDEILSQIIHPDDLSRLWAEVEASLNPENPKPFFTEYRINRPDGQMRWIEAHGVASFEGNGKEEHAVSFVGTVLDITERKLADQKLQKSYKELEMFNRSMVHRELKMIELKKEINELCLKAGLPKRYNIDFSDEKQKK